VLGASADFRTDLLSCELEQGHAVEHLGLMGAPDIADLFLSLLSADRSSNFLFFFFLSQLLLLKCLTEQYYYLGRVELSFGN
jgi:hypothetical protein